MFCQIREKQYVIVKENNEYYLITRSTGNKDYKIDILKTFKQKNKPIIGVKVDGLSFKDSLIIHRGNIDNFSVMESDFEEFLV